MVRSAAQRDIDTSALRAIAQAAVNVELCTIPLYMVALYSLVGFHPIVGKGNDFYRNRQWPGAVTVANPVTENERAFNTIFSVFIEEMLHVQLAANIATAVGVTPTFTSPVLCNARHAWTCYGPDKTVIPHIIDLADTTRAGLTVQTTALTRQQLELFLAIEENAAQARASMKGYFSQDKYFPVVPFAGWDADMTEVDLPLFGTIDHMYQCYYSYLSLRYDDGSILWDHVFDPDGIQNDMFNYVDKSGHPEGEYPGLSATITATSPVRALRQVLSMINAITDQGEGSMLDVRVTDPDAVQDVVAQYQANTTALDDDYPSYTDTGSAAESADTSARTAHGTLDHYERFSQVQREIGRIETWDAWHTRRPTWTVQDFLTADAVSGADTTGNPYGLPTAADIADAYNRMAAPGARAAAHRLVSAATVGSLAGVTTVLDAYWTTPGVVFPYPAMVGSADRMATCWALFGQPPDLTTEIEDAAPGVLYHGCQALNLTVPGNSCGPVVNYHSCRGSNTCGGRGGCGFVHPADAATPGASCGFALVKSKATADAELFSAPSDNQCAFRGGCAVPIAAAQRFPQSGTMQLVDFADDATPEPFGTMPFETGEGVHDVAYRAFVAVMRHRDPDTELPDTPPPPSDIRLVFPPST